MNKTKLIAAFLGTSLAMFAVENEPPVGIQLVSLNEALGANLGQGLSLVKSLGFTLVETAGNYGMTGDQLRKEGIEFSFIEDEGVDPPKEIPVSLHYLSSIGR
jgi:hypothetical protein